MSDLFQRSFAAGEISPDLYARSDQVKYQTGLRTCVNFFVRKSGGISNRAGTRFIAEANKNTTATWWKYRQIPFVFNKDQSYVIEMSHLSVRIIKRGALITINPATYNPAFVYGPGDAVLYAGSNYVAQTVTNNQQPDLYPAVWTRLHQNIYQLSSPFTEDQLADLQYFQSNDVMFFAQKDTDPNAGLIRLNRLADDKWYFDSVFFDQDWGFPPSGVSAVGSAGNTNYHYRITAVSFDGRETRAYGQNFAISAKPPTTTDPINVTWSGPLGQPTAEWRLYRSLQDNGAFGYVGTATGSTFRDIYGEPDYSYTLPESKAPPRTLNGQSNVPSVIGIVQQRLVLANMKQEPEKVYMSKIGDFYNFVSNVPPQDDDPLSFVLASRRFGHVRHFIEIGGVPVIFTDTGEWILKGDNVGTITPTAINASQYAYNGSSSIVAPVMVDDSAIYVQARGSIIRDLKYSQESDGYKGNDLTVYSSHLFENHTILAMDYQQNPDSIVWVLRDDNMLLGLSYLKEHQVWGWHRHETDGKVISICVIPEGNLDVLYLIVERVIQGMPYRYLEYLTHRVEKDPLNMYYVDCGLSYNGMANQFSFPGMYIALSSQQITPNDVILLTATSSYFTPQMVGNAIVFYRYSDDRSAIIDKARFNIVEYIDPSHVNVTPNRDVPVWAVATLTWDWSLAVDEFFNLAHLNGKSVAIVADGNVVCNGIEEPQCIVENGQVTIPRASSFVHIGLPYVADMETLDIDFPQQMTTVRPKPKIASHVSVVVKNTPVLKVGTSFDRLTETKIREFEDMGSPTNPKTGLVDVTVDSAWDEETRMCVRQDNPLPATILTVIPNVLIAKE